MAMQPDTVPTEESLPLRRRRPPRPPSPSRGNWITSFDDAQLPAPLLRGVYAYGLEHPPPIVAQSLRDTVGGKSCHLVDTWGAGLVTAFCIAAACRIDTASLRVGHPQVLIVEPTREHAWNVFALFKSLTKFVEPVAAAGGAPPQEVSRIIVGGECARTQWLALKSTAIAALVGTPGRITDMAQRGAIKLADVRCVALDPIEDLDEKGFGDHIVDLMRMIPPPTPGPGCRVQVIAASHGKHPALLSRVLPFFGMTVCDGGRPEGAVPADTDSTQVMMQHVARHPVVPTIDDYVHHVVAQPYVDHDAPEARAWAVAEFLDRFAHRHPPASKSRPVVVGVRLATRRWAVALAETLRAMNPVPHEELIIGPPPPGEGGVAAAGGGGGGAVPTVLHRGGSIRFVPSGRAQSRASATRDSYMCEAVIHVAHADDSRPTSSYLEVLGEHAAWSPGGERPRCRRIVTLVLYPRDPVEASDGATSVADRWISRVSADLQAQRAPATIDADAVPNWPFSRFVWGPELPPE